MQKWSNLDIVLASVGGGLFLLALVVIVTLAFWTQRKSEQITTVIENCQKTRGTRDIHIWALRDWVCRKNQRDYEISHPQDQMVAHPQHQMAMVPYGHPQVASGPMGSLQMLPSMQGVPGSVQYGADLATTDAAVSEEMMRVGQEAHRLAVEAAYNRHLEVANSTGAVLQHVSISQPSGAGAQVFQCRTEYPVDNSKFAGGNPGWSQVQNLPASYYTGT